MYWGQKELFLNMYLLTHFCSAVVDVSVVSSDPVQSKLSLSPQLLSMSGSILSLAVHHLLVSLLVLGSLSCIGSFSSVRLCLAPLLLSLVLLASDRVLCPEKRIFNL